MQKVTITPPLPKRSPSLPMGTERIAPRSPTPFRGGEQFVRLGESSEGQSLPQPAEGAARKIFAISRPRPTDPPSGVMLAGEE